jgi:hypothetical protein
MTIRLGIDEIDREALAAQPVVDARDIGLR